MIEVKLFCANGDKNYETKSFGLYYEVIKTKTIYGSEEDINRFKKFISIVGFESAINKLADKSAINNYDIALKDTITEMKRIGSLYGLDIKEVDYDMINKRYFDHGDYFHSVRYFYKYMQGRVLHHRLEELGVE